MQHKLNLIVNDNIHSAFLKANSALLKKYKINNNEKLVSAWKDEYNAEIVFPEYIAFKNENDLTMFLIKWN
jgi:hypothetical protein